MADRHSNQQIPALTGAFSDPRVILVRMDDPRLASLSTSECHIEQSFDTPTYVAIGYGATNEQLENVDWRNRRTGTLKIGWNGATLPSVSAEIQDTL